MGWYDLFALFYDRSLEDLYAPFRHEAMAALELAPGHRVLDAPCGTGQSLPGLAPRVGSTGEVVGLDASRGMLKRARRRVQREGWSQVILHNKRLPEDLPIGPEDPGFDAILCALGLSALPEDAFEALWEQLRPGGRFVLFDVYAESPTLQTRVVERMAQANLGVRWWEGLATASRGFTKEVLPADPEKMGGELYLAAGWKPA